MIKTLAIGLTACSTLAAQTKTTWVDATTLRLEGKAWPDTFAPFDRLPRQAKGVVRAPVWKLSRNSAGMVVRFKTKAAAIDVRWTLTGKNLAMPHMPATGVSGVDLYVRFKGRWRWLAVGRPTRFPDNQARLVSGLSPESREYLLYLPLYNGVSKVAIGVPAGTSVASGSPPQHRLPLVFYGTSITQGGCASRPGMVHTAILGRQLDRPVINLGFSGNGTMDPSITELLAGLEVACYVIDCLPNMRGEQVRQRVGPLVRTLRKARPKTPILLVEDRGYTNAFLKTSLARRNRDNRAALRQEFEGLRRAGVGGLSYLRGDALLGDDGEATVDGSHPTDLGFARQAGVFGEKLRAMLSKR